MLKKLIFMSMPAIICFAKVRVAQFRWNRNTVKNRTMRIVENMQSSFCLNDRNGVLLVSQLLHEKYKGCRLLVNVR